MKSGAYFQSNPPPPATGSYFTSKTFNPYNQPKPSYEFGQKAKVIHNGIRLVGLANSPNHSK